MTLLVATFSALALSAAFSGTIQDGHSVTATATPGGVALPSGVYAQRGEHDGVAQPFGAYHAMRKVRVDLKAGTISGDVLIAPSSGGNLHFHVTGQVHPSADGFDSAETWTGYDGGKGSAAATVHTSLATGAFGGTFSGSLGN